MIKLKHKFYLIIGLLIVAFIWLAVLAYNQPYFGFDLEFSRWLQSNIGRTHFPWQGIAYFVSFFGITLVATILVLFTALVFAINRMRLEALFVILAPLASLINFFIKIWVDRLRPMGDLITVIDRQFDPSFPSGHTVFYTVFFGFLIAVMMRRKELSSILRYTIITICSLLIVLISVARIALGAHWTSDVVGGYLLGLICLGVLYYFYSNHIKNL